MNETATLLTDCEHGDTFAFDTRYDGIVDISCDAQDILVVSDLHMAAGLNANETYTGMENFYADRAFRRFLEHSRHDGDASSTLVINGDFIDFLRIAAIPTTDAQFEAWLQTLLEIGCDAPQTIGALKASIAVEIKQGYGLKTDDFKSVWKLLVASSGHADVFTALAEWITGGNDVIITKGNHDLEWYWLAVRNCLRLVLARQIAESKRITEAEALRQYVFGRLRFINNALVMDGQLYIEHGQRYDNFTNVVPEEKPVLSNGTELNIPFGSFFNRYLLNRIELRYPFYENVRPRVSLLPMLIKQDFPLAIRVFFRYIPFLLKTLTKKRYWAMILQTFSLFFTIAVPLAVFIVVVFFQFKNGIVHFVEHQMAPSAPPTDILQWLEAKGLTVGKDISILIASYFLSRVVSMLQLVEPDDLLNAAENVDSTQSATYPDLRIITMGHTHEPQQCALASGKWFYNTGTWIPVIEASSAAVREDRTYTFLRFRRTPSGIEPHPLLRWNDDATRSDELVLVVPGDVIADAIVRKTRSARFKERARFFFAKR